MATVTPSVAMPPSYSQVTGIYPPSEPSPHGFPLSYVDFIPAMISPGGVLSNPTFERFGDLMRKANNWLLANPTLWVKNCESLETRVRGGVTNTDASTSYDMQKRNGFVRCLRIWIASKTAADVGEPQQLGYINVVPACQDSGGFLSLPTFDTLGETVSKMNAMLTAQPLPGRILNLETQDIKLYTWTGSIDPEESCWVETSQQRKTFINIIRLFYEAGPPAYEQIGCADFVPACLEQGSLFKLFVFEPFSAVLLKAQQWIQAQPAIHVASVQSVDYKIYSSWSSTTLDTQCTVFQERGESMTCYVRILRVCYVTSMFQSRLPLTALACKAFIPCQLTEQGMLVPPTFESQSETMRRALAWLQATGARVISSETVPLKKGINFQFDPNNCLTVNSKAAQQELFVLRVYLDGYYTEPPPEVLPPAPVVGPPASLGCCTVL
ncbi:hypothetical protein NP493_30g00029 [Ridgeia piscesae]|uniref:Uncharacterized protein n=1 Tax=Ridgeia piscesae TaxID=27915 RepID=A0AAD9PD78_RIDPI|nr:hypothetical protein NP493_30g00029 [Ridgeia piscesae]